MEIFIEPVTMPSVILFGAGHVGQAVCSIGATAGFRFVVADDREGFPTEERFPLASARLACPWKEAVGAASIGEADFVIVMTRGHKDDIAVLKELADRGVTPRYLGLIGSKSKFITLRRHLEADGVDPKFLDRVKTPIGLDIGARSAEEIAISVMAELVSIRRKAR